jgi:zinc transporter ZupT
MRRDALLIAAMIPLGALVVLASPTLSGTSLGVLIGIAAGALVYIATGHLLPEAHSEERRPGIAAAFSIALLGTVLLVGAMQG